MTWARLSSYLWSSLVSVGSQKVSVVSFLLHIYTGFWDIDSAFRIVVSSHALPLFSRKSTSIKRKSRFTVPKHRRNPPRWLSARRCPLRWGVCGDFRYCMCFRTSWPVSWEWCVNGIRRALSTPHLICRDAMLVWIVVLNSFVDDVARTLTRKASCLGHYRYVYCFVKCGNV